VRQARIKIPAAEASAVYHCVSRTVNGEWLFDDVAKEVFRRQLRQVSEYCGVEIITYVVLSNHFHLLVRVPQKTETTDAELLRRHSILYPQPTPYQLARLEVIRSELLRNGPEAIAWRRRQLTLMGDVSQFLKLLKQRFSIWFNKRHRRFGTLWAERFKSVLVEQQPHVLEWMAAYIDLNPVRAGLTEDPKDYRFCAYAEAVAGDAFARAGIAAAVGATSWADAQACYREILFGIGAAPRNGASSIGNGECMDVMRKRGRLSAYTILRCRLRYLSDGAVLGTRAFVAVQLETIRRKAAVQTTKGPPTPLGEADRHSLITLRKVRTRIGN
jgi:putative transposase